MSADIVLTNVPVRPTITEYDTIMEQVSQQLGERWLAGREDGGWVFQADGKAGTHSRRRDFFTALAEATGKTISVERRG